jgi:pteridine reductase
MTQEIIKQNAALITGGAKRIGREIAINLAKKGYDIVINYNNSQSEAEELAKEITKEFKVKCEIFKCDLEDKKQAAKLFDFALEKFPYLNLLVNNASIFNKSKFLTSSYLEFERNFNLHVISPMFLSHEFAKNILEKNIINAQIINMVDKNIVRFDTSYFHYLLSKKLLAEMTKMLSLELAPKIRVNAIAPGFILNNVNEKNPSEETTKLLKKIPLKKKGEVENICQTVNFLINNEFITGQILFIDGGASLNHAG